MENVMEMTSGFAELSAMEMQETDCGGLSDVFEKINPITLAKCIYHAGEDFGASSVKFGAECYDFYRDVKKIFS